MLGARFGRDAIGDAKHQVGIPGCRKSYGLRKDRRDAGTGHAVQALVPPVVSRDVQACDGGRAVDHLRDFLFERHAGDQVVDSLCNRQARVLVLRQRLAGLRQQRQAEHRRDNDGRNGFSGFHLTYPSSRRDAGDRNLCAGQSCGLRFELDLSRSACDCTDNY